MDAVESCRLTGAAAVRAVRTNAYRRRLLERIWGAELFAWAGAVAGAVPVHLVRRLAGRWSVGSVAEAVDAVVSPARL